MNKQRRQDLGDVSDLLDEAIDRLSEIRDEEQDAFDNLPEGLQMSDRGSKMEEAIDDMYDIENDIDAVKLKIEKIIKA